MEPRIATDREAPFDLGDVYAREGPRLWRALFAYGHDREIASDAVAEAFAQCLRRGDAIRDPRAWVWRSAFRIAAGELERKRRNVTDIPDGSYEMVEPGPLLAALRRLAPRQRAVLVLRHYAGYGTGEIGAILGIGRPTVRVHLSRGRKRLAMLLREEDDDG